MAYRVAADGVMLVHVVWLVFVVGGGLLVARWGWVAWLHVPAVLWGALVEFTGWVCPLTPWENALRRMGGQEGYAQGFIERYVTALIYPEGLTREMQVALGVGVLLLNGIVYGRLLLRRRTQRFRQR